MKITNEDICRQLKKIDGQDWVFGFGWYWGLHPCFYVKDKFIPEMHWEFKTSIPLNLSYTSPLKFVKASNNKKIKQIFENFDWKEAYQNRTITLEYDPCRKTPCRVFEHKSDTDGFKLFFTSKRLEKAVENAVKEQMIKPNKEKPDEGRGGK